MCTGYHGAELVERETVVRHGGEHDVDLPIALAELLHREVDLLLQKQKKALWPT